MDLLEQLSGRVFFLFAVALFLRIGIGLLLREPWTQTPVDHDDDEPTPY